MQLHSALALSLLLLSASCTLQSAERSPEAAAPQSATAALPRTAEEAAVLASVQRFFDTMTARDSIGTRSVLDDEGDFVSVRWGDDGNAIVRRAPNAAYLAGMRNRKDTYLERLWDAEVRIHGPIATVWTPYDFHINGTFSHCGVDAFQLRKTDAGWMITGGTYTVERTGCAPSPLGTPTP